MSKFLMLFVLLVGITGCSGADKAAQAKAYVAGCSNMAHAILEPAGYTVNQPKLDEECQRQAAAYLKK